MGVVEKRIHFTTVALALAIVSGVFTAITIDAGAMAALEIFKEMMVVVGILGLFICIIWWISGKIHKEEE
jgi:hypothetical protein